MHYWRIYLSAEKEVGFFPQVYDMEFTGQVDDPNFISNLRFDQCVDSNTIIPGGHLHRRAKLTDLMSVAFFSGPEMISSKLHDLLRDSTIENVEFGESFVINGKTGIRLPYFVMRPVLKSYECLDIQNSEMVLFNMADPAVSEKLTFESAPEYILAYHQNRRDVVRDGFHNARPLVMKTLAIKQNCDVDLFSVFGVEGGVGYYMSDRLKDKCLDAGCTGIIFREINQKYP